MKRFSLEMKVGLFAAAMIAVAAVATVKVSERAVTAGRGYELVTTFPNATGLKEKAPVELAGVEVGIVKGIELENSRAAKVTLLLNRDVKLPEDSQAFLRTRGFLGETIVELIPGSIGAKMLDKGEEIKFTGSSGDLNSLMNQFHEIAYDIKEITSSLKTLVGNDSTSPINKIVNNLDKFTETMQEITTGNQENANRIASNLAEFTEQLKEVLAQGRGNLEESMDRIASITRKIDEGKGTVGKLVNDDETIEKLNEAVDNLNATLGGFKQLETEVGYHTEYMARSEDFKHYVSLALKPAPDKSFLLDIVSDPNPNPRHIERTTDVTINGTTSTVDTHTATIDRNAVRISAQLAKKFYDFQIRGGIIESTGGLGLDYFYGPMGAHASAFDFTTRYGERPHIKLMADVNLTKNFYLTGGADDLINPDQPTDYFFGGGFRLVDDDIKSLAKISGASSLLGK